MPPQFFLHPLNDKISKIGSDQTFLNLLKTLIKKRKFNLVLTRGVWNVFKKIQNGTFGYSAFIIGSEYNRNWRWRCRTIFFDITLTGRPLFINRRTFEIKFEFNPQAPRLDFYCQINSFSLDSNYTVVRGHRVQKILKFENSYPMTRHRPESYYVIFFSPPKWLKMSAQLKSAFGISNLSSKNSSLDWCSGNRRFKR